MDNWLRKYMDFLTEERRVSAYTAKCYFGDLQHWLTALTEAGIRNVEELRSSHLRAYIDRLQVEGKSTATINRRIVSIQAFCKYLVMQQVLKEVPTLHLERPKAEPKSTPALTEAEVDKLLLLPDVRTAYGLRDRAMLELNYASGLRVSELLTLDVQQVRLNMGFLLCLGAGGKERMVPIGTEGVKWLDKYLQQARSELLGERKAEPALFLNHLGKRMTRQGYWKLLTKYGDQLDIALTPHSLRQAFAAHMLSSGADVRAVQEMMGHKAAASTQSYQPPAKLMLKSIYDNHHPRARRKSE